MQLPHVTDAEPRLPRRRTAIGFMAAAAMLSATPATVVSTDVESMAKAGSLQDPFFTYSRPAEYHVIREDVLVPLRDGSYIVGQLYRPGRTPTELAIGTFPGIVV